MRFGFAALAAFPARIIAFYVGSAEKDSIEYWQSYMFYVIALIGTVAGTLCIVPVFFWLLLTGRPVGVLVLIPYAFNVFMVFTPRLSIKAKTAGIAAGFYLIGLASLVLAGPEGESGIWFSVTVLILSLFVGFKASFLIACLDFATGMVFATLHAKGLIGWSVLKDFKFFSWVIQGLNIFLIDLTFAAANAALIRGVGRSFESLRAAEAKVLGFLSEKKTLIREIYHRSKNNMQVVSSILKLSSAKLGDETSKAVFKDVISKIMAMSLVHQKLYESQDLSNIAMPNYIGELANLLMESYGVPPGKVALELEVEDISMQIDTAIPCGLVISEILANSLKYAFPKDRKGRISIAMRKADEDYIVLRISDDGAGVPEGFSISSNRRMGIATIFTIVNHQLQGSIEFSSEGGVSYLIRFKRKLYEERIGSDGK